ncbi:uncharacterized protein LOC106999282 [Macaca mulatta]
MPGHRLGLRPSQPEAPAAQNWHQAGKVVAGPRVRALGARAHWPPGAGEAGGKDAGRPAAVSPRPAPRTREAILRARRGAARWLRGHPGGHRAKGPPIPSSHSSSRAAHGSGTRVERSLPARPRQMPCYSLPRGLEERMAAVFLPTASRTLRRGCPVPGAAAAEPGCACRGCWGERRPDMLWSQKTAKREAEVPVARVQSWKGGEHETLLEDNGRDSRSHPAQPPTSLPSALSLLLQLGSAHLSLKLSCEVKYDRTASFQLL